MRVPGVRVGLWIVLAGALAPAAFAAERISCSGVPAAVTFDDASDTEAACRGAGDAFVFLQSNGLTVGAAVEIHIVSTVPAGMADDVFGCFDKASDRAYILTYATCSEAVAEKGFLGGPLTPALYRGLVAHEVAHVVADRNFTIENPSYVAHEYIAYVTQFAVLPAAVRQRILGRIRPRGTVTTSEINSFVLMMSPDVFAANAYLHYSRPENGTAFIQNLLRGEIVPNANSRTHSVR